MKTNQNKIEKLTSELCPNGVEFFELGRICEVKTGQGISKNFISQHPGEFPVINSGKDPLGFVDQYNTQDDPIGITSRGAGVGSITWCNEKYFRGNLNYGVTLLNRDLINIRFFYHILLESQEKIENLCTFNAIPALNKSSLEKLQIPVPPLPIQQEIVKILDNFTELEAKLEAKLEAELEARKKQYEYYRNELLTPKKDIKYISLGDVAEIQRGASPRPIQKYITNDPTGVPWIKIGDTLPGSKYVTSTKQRVTTDGALKSRHLKKGNFILSNSMSYGRPYILGIDGAIHDGWAGISDFEEKLDHDFLYHYLSSSTVQNYWDSKINSGSVSNLNSEIIKTLPVPISSLEEQKRIVSILNKFDALVNDISIGLPSELNARRKQYEYYRNKLLTFPELKKGSEASKK